jgi:hypothetical protein
MESHSDILKFIDDFKAMHREEIEDLFSNGYCYYFCIILIHRFNLSSANLYYVPVYNHFITKIGRFYYDIKGTVMSKDVLKLAVKWSEYKKEEPLDSARIIRDCIKKESYDE